MPSVTDQAICIRVWDWSETSQTVSLLTREHGILRGLAKGSKRPHARFSGGIDLLTRGEIVASIRPTERGGGLTPLIAWDLQELFPGVRRSVRALYCAMAMADLTQNALLEGDPHPEVFDALVEALRSLERPGQDLPGTCAFAWTLVDRTGHRPELEIDVNTGAALPDQPVYAFDPRRGAISEEDSGAGRAADCWRVRRETVQYLRELGREQVPGGKFPDETIARALRLVLFYFREASGREMPAVRTLLGTLENLG